MSRLVSPKLVRLAVGASLAVGLAAVPLPAWAGDAYSNQDYYSVNGIQYWNQALVSTSYGLADGYGFAGPSSVCVGAGYVATQGRVLQDWGTASAMVAETPVHYSPQTLCPGDNDNIGAAYQAHGNFYARGTTWGWNSSTSGYEGYYTLFTPDQSA